MKRRLRLWARLTVGLFTLGILIFPANPAILAQPTTHWVNDDDPNSGGYVLPGTSCTDPGYPTIQAAVNAAGPGHRINVCPGTYVEQVTIPAGKNNLTLRSTSLWQAVVKAPAPPLVMLDPKALVRVSTSTNVTILGFTIAGPGPGGCDSIRYGVRVDGGGSANIFGNHITDIRDLPAPPNVSGCQNGVAVLVGRNFEATMGSARIEGNLIDNYQKNGPTVDNAGSNAIIRANRILGVGPSATIAQNGFQVSRGATAEVAHNFVSGHVYTPQTFAGSGGILFEAGAVNAHHNTVLASDVGVYVSSFFAAANNLQTQMVAHNRVRASTFDAVVLEADNNNSVRNNHLEQNGGPGIGLYPGASNSQGNALDSNQIERNGGGGILLNDADNNAVHRNHVRNNGTSNGDTTDGIRLDSLSAGNTVQGNHLRGNVTYDCHDFSVGGGTSGTANTWIDNHGETSVPAGICSGPDPQDSFAVVAGWDPSYPWYSSDPLAVEYNWPSVYSTIDTQLQNVLQLLPRPGFGRARPASPQQ